MDCILLISNLTEESSLIAESIKMVVDELGFSDDLRFSKEDFDGIVRDLPAALEDYEYSDFVLIKIYWDEFLINTSPASRLIEKVSDEAPFDALCFVPKDANTGWIDSISSSYGAVRKLVLHLPR